LSTRDVTYIAVFAALWGAIEIGLGTYLHAVAFPLTGLLMSTIGLGIALTARRVVGRSGSVIGVAAVTAGLKALSFGGVVLSPIAAILIQGALAELVTWGPERPARWRMCLGGALGVTWSVFHPLLSQGIIAGKGIYQMYLRLIERALGLFGLDLTAALVALGLLVLLHLAAGAAAGALAGVIADSALRRLQPGTASEEREDER
jgi:hypothetical protein